jgi:hypothetical protein
MNDVLKSYRPHNYTITMAEQIKLRSFLYEKLTQEKMELYLLPTVSGFTRRHSCREISQKLQMTAVRAEDDELEDFFGNLMVGRIKSNRLNVFASSNWPDLTGGPDVDQYDIEDMSEIEKECDDKVDAFESKWDENQNLRTYLMRQIHDGIIRDFCRNRDGTDRSPLNSLISDLFDIAEEAKDKQLADFFRYCLYDCPYSEREELLMNAIHWPDPKEGPDLDLEIVEPIAELKFFLAEARTIMGQINQDLTERYLCLRKT